MIYGAGERAPGALCLSRNPGEKLLIGDNIEIKVIKVRGCRVYLSIIAPKELEIDREEVRVKKLASRVEHEEQS